MWMLLYLTEPMETHISQCFLWVCPLILALVYCVLPGQAGCQNLLFFTFLKASWKPLWTRMFTTPADQCCSWSSWSGERTNTASGEWCGAVVSHLGAVLMAAENDDTFKQQNDHLLRMTFPPFDILKLSFYHLRLTTTWHDWSMPKPHLLPYYDHQDIINVHSLSHFSLKNSLQ